ncbi:T9SS type A sorting domain-containing protein [Zobellia barbeyronii]|uniref:T9SS type A sorting domain-containing protein n=1 Tax=Zobellia barbeyronii TaxID=2748009 RepID=A0ABS5W9M0_9FLAO|nr:T9SS type A sorting domain-containing protein [Zobellia barbeyronii]MBT2160032.1 T9SS type A sorting domain-containing protein [Zobellia barbeyronii]
MKKIALILLPLFSVFFSLNAQEPDKYQLNVKSDIFCGVPGSGSYEWRTRTTTVVKVTDISGNIITADCNNNYNVKPKTVDIEFYCNYRYCSNGSPCSDGGATENSSRDLFKFTIPDNFNAGTINKFDTTLELTSFQSLSSPALDGCEIEVNINPNIEIELGNYVVEYKTQNRSFLPLPNEFQNIPKIKLKAEDLGISSEIVLLKLTSCASLVDSNILNLSFTGCPPKFSGVPVPINAKCKGEANGGVKITVETIPTDTEFFQIEYYKNGEDFPNNSPKIYTGDFIGNSYSFLGLDAGDYEIILKSGLIAGGALNAGDTITFSVDEPEENVSFSHTITDITCKGSSDGKIIINAQGGTPPFQYSLNSGTFQNLNEFSGLAVGDFDVVVKDSNNCTTNPSTIAISDGVNPPDIDVLSLSTAEAANGQGKISVLVTGGSGTLQFSWTKDGSPFNPNASNDPANLTGLNPAVYKLIVTDQNGNGCSSDELTFTIGEIPELNVSISTIEQINCEDDTAQLTATATNGSGTGYLYSWYKGTDTTGELLTPTTNAVSVQQGTYTVEVTDSGGDTQTATYTLDYEQPLLTVTENITQILCRGESAGAIVLTVTGGVNPLVYWDGSFTPSSSSRTDLLSDTYTYEIIDENNCRLEGSITITEPPTGITVSATSTDVTTNGGNDGTIALSISNGGSDYTYVWIETTTNTVYNPNLSTNPDEFIGFTAGTYQVVVTDINNNGCTTTLPQAITIDEPGPLNLLDPQFETAPINCFGESTGKIVAKYTGTAPFTFAWFKGINKIKEGIEDFIENQPFGNDYSYTVVDASGITITSDAITISQPTATLSATHTQADVSCFGGNDGTITVNGTGGSGQLIYEISGGSATQVSPGNFINLEAGTYVVNVTDAVGCSIAVPLNIVLIPPTEVTFDDINAVTPVSSSGGSDGSISVTVQGGVQPYYYRWFGPSGQLVSTETIPSTTTIENLPEGTYTLTVSNDEFFTACNTSKSYNVTEQAVQPITGTPTCFGQATGSLTATIAATGLITFKWTLEDGTIAATETTTLRTVTTEGLAAGIYYLEIEDENGLTVRSPNNFEIVELPEVSATIVPVPTCSGSNTGSITFIPSGTLTYFYSIDGGTTFQPEPVFENLADITYNLQVRATESPNCDYVQSGVRIGVSPGMYWDENNSSIVRASGPEVNDGSIIAAFTGGTEPYNYSLNNGTPQLTNVFADLSKGTYSVTVTDAAGCSASQDFEVTEIGPLTISNINVTDASCLGEANGSITTTVTGEGDITFLWTLGNDVNGNPIPVPVSNGTDGPNITGILAGNYILTVTDDNATRFTEAIAVGEPTNSVTVTNVALTDVSCFGGNDGTLEVEAGGGTGPYTYSINGGDYETSNLFEDLSAGNYTISVRDANNCTFTEPTPEILLEPQELGLAFIDIKPVTLPNASDGAISITVEGGLGTYTYSWSGPNGYTSVDKDVLNGEAGDYVVTITDAENASCSYTSDPIKITEPGELIVTLFLNETLSCSSDSDAVIIANVQGDQPFTYQWFEVVNTNTIELEETTNIIGDLPAGIYLLKVTDSNNITLDSTIEISAPTPLNINIDNSTNVICAGEATGSINITVTGGTPPYQYFWSNSATVPDISGLDAGEYIIEVQDEAGCIAQETITITPPGDAIQIVDAAIINVTEYQGIDGSISLDITGGSAPYSYAWTRISDNSITGNQRTISNLAADSYLVTVSDVNGCSVTEIYEVTQPDIVVGTIIQPTCSGDSNGSISVLANEGNGTFSYLWNTGATESDINNLAAGTYSVTVTGFESGPINRTYVLENPAPLEVDLGSDRILCAGQTLELDATVDDETATYSWSSDNGFSSSEPNIELTATGNYTVTVQSETGCIAEGNIFVDISSDEINAEFAVSSQVFTGESIIAVDISYPLPDGIEWILPVQAKIETQNRDEAQFSFAEAGEYEVSIITTRGDCVAQKTKKIVVVVRDGLITEEDTKNGKKLIEDFLVYPNPSDGRFTADVTLTEIGDINIRVFSLANNALMASKRDRDALSYSIPFDLSSLPAGVYAVLLETPYGQTLRKVIIK